MTTNQVCARCDVSGICECKIARPVEDRMRTALLTLMGQHRFNSTRMLPHEVHTVCYEALNGAYEEPEDVWAVGLFVSSNNPKNLVRMVATGRAEISEYQAHKDFIRWEHTHD